VSSLSLRGIAANSWRIWRRDIRALTILAAALELPIMFVDVLLHVAPGVEGLTEETVTFGFIALLVIVYAALSHHFLAGLLERVVASERHGHPPPTLSEVIHDLPWMRLVIADLLLTGVLAITLVPLVIPGLVAMTWFAVVLPIVNLERNPVLPSFARSYHLVRGHSWRVFAVVITVFLIPDGIIGFITGLVHELTDHPVLNAVAHAVPAIILMPIAALPIVVLAFDLVALEERERRLVS
jgi:hypothetical protein